MVTRDGTRLGTQWAIHESPLRGCGCLRRPVVGMIRDLPGEMTVLMIEHDMDVAFDLADRIVVLHQGRLLAEGDPDTIRKDSQVAQIYLGAD